MKEAVLPVFEDDSVLEATKRELDVTIKAIEGMLTFSEKDRNSAFQALQIIAGPDSSPKGSNRFRGFFPIEMDKITSFINDNFPFILPK